MRSPADADIQVIDITNRCFLRCSGCTRDIAHQSETKEMSPETFRLALKSLSGWWRPGKVIGIIGGEPTIASNFREICKIFREEFNPGELTLGREPIGDFNAFAIERLFDRSNGKGLWTSFGPKFRDHYEDVMLTFSHWNPNDHSQSGLHQASLVDASEMCELLNIPYEDFPKWRDACWLQGQWSGSISTNGKAYFCERAASLDMLYTNGSRGWDIEKEPDWWKRTPDQFGSQLEICEMCSMCLPGPSRVDATDRDIISHNHRNRLAIAKSPVIPKGKFDLISELPVIDQRTITTKDNYVGDSGIRVAADNKHVRPKKVSCVVVSVGCDEQLREALPKAVAAVGEVVVATHERDTKTREVCKSLGVRYLDCNLIPEGDAFNKGVYLNAGLSLLDKPDWVLFTDADIILPENFREFFFSHSWNPGCLYYTSRDEGVSGEVINSWPNGYFQLWHPTASALKEYIVEPHGTPMISEAFCSAGGVDSWFAQQYPESKRIFVPELAVHHLDHGEFSRRWNGNHLRRCWKQVGVIDFLRRFQPCGDPLPFEARDGVCEIRLTDTKFALQHTTEMVKGILSIEEVLEFRPDGMTFLGRDIGQCHVHVAARF